MPNNQIKKKDLLVTERDKVLNIEKALIENADGENIVTTHDTDAFPLKHIFADGVYVRQMYMAKGTVVIGAIQNHLHVWYLLTGNIVAATEDGIVDYKAPCYVVAQSGTKRVIHAVEDSIFINIHKNPTNTQDLDELEKQIVSSSYEEYEKYVNNKNNII